MLTIEEQIERLVDAAMDQLDRDPAEAEPPLTGPPESLRSVRWAGVAGADLDAAWESGDTVHLNSPTTTTPTLIDPEPAPTPPTSRGRWPILIAAAAVVLMLVGALVLVARDEASEPQVPVAPPADPTVVESAGTRVGFIGLPPEGATPSTPPGLPSVVSIVPCYAPIGEPSEIDTLPPLGALWVFGAGMYTEGGYGRLIWQKFEDLPEGANSRSTGLLEQRLTPEGVELMHSEAIAALSSGEISPDDLLGCHAERGYSVTAGWEIPDQDARYISADNEHLARIIDPWSWLPASAWEDPEITAYVPYEYRVAFEAVDETVDVVNDQLGGEVRAGDTHQLTAALPAAAAHLIDIRAWECNGGRAIRSAHSVVCSAMFTIDDARALAAVLDEAGLEQDELLNAYRLDYEFEYPDGALDVPMHIWISANPPGCEPDTPVVYCNWFYSLLEEPDAIAAPDAISAPAGPAASETTAADTTTPDDTPAAD